MAGKGNIYASGRNSLAECPRCGLPVPYSQLRKDGQNKNFVCADCWDPKHPQEKIPMDIYDAAGLRHPRKDRVLNNEEFRFPSQAGTITAFSSSIRGVVT